MWTPGIGDEDPTAGIWLLRLGFPIAFIAALRNTLKSKPDLSLAQKLKEITPADDSICPLCKGTIVLGHGWHCSQCGLKRTVVNSG